MSLALNYKMIAYKGINDHYIKGVEHEKMVEHGKYQKEITRKIKRRDTLCRFHLLDYNVLGVIIFKTLPQEELIKELSESNYEIRRLQENPYINAG